MVAAPETTTTTIDDDPYDSNNELRTFVERKLAEKEESSGIFSKKYFQTFIFSLIALSLIGFYFVLGKFVYWSLIDTKPPIEITEMWTETPVISRNEPIVVKFNYKKDRYCEGTVVHYLIAENGKHVFLSESPSYLQKISSNEIQTGELLFEFPKYLSSGEWKFKSIGHYKCNPITSSYVEGKTLSITVKD